MREVQVDDMVRVHYTGKLEDGTEFDTSIGKDPLEKLATAKNGGYDIVEIMGNTARKLTKGAELFCLQEVLLHLLAL